jgi:hypothetical protein
MTDVVFWRGFNTRTNRTTAIVDHPDKVWELTGDAHNSIARNWHVVKVYADGTLVTMIGCAGRCGCTKPSHMFNVEILEHVGSFRTIYTCIVCGGDGVTDSINFNTHAVEAVERAKEVYTQAKKEMKEARDVIDEALAELNDEWNTLETFEG